MSSSLRSCHSDIDLLQLLADDLFQASRLIEVGEEFLGESVDLFRYRLVVAVIGLGRAYISTRGEDVLLLADFFQARRVAEAGDILVLQAGPF